ncbi:hypothetical protein VTJ04DRAFT_5651 [Mycothermus thermophilus]|uniref:uncharacterized protein n=1 Tax=Humicola insolens TaxID=85995 RepID=UPI003741F75F
MALPRAGQDSWTEYRRLLFAVPSVAPVLLSALACHEKPTLDDNIPPFHGSSCSEGEDEESHGMPRASVQRLYEPTF